MIDYSPYEPKHREPPENYRISKRYGPYKPDRKKPESGVQCPDCTSDYQHCTWWDSDRNKNWGKPCKDIIKRGKCPRKCKIYRTPKEIQSKVQCLEEEATRIKKELKGLQKDATLESLRAQPESSSKEK